MNKAWAGFLFAFVLPIIIVLAWWGAFSHATISETVSTPIHYAWIDYTGDLTDLPEAQSKFRDVLSMDHIAPGRPVVVLLTDPRKSVKNKQHARIGYEVPLQTVAPTTTIHIDDIPARHVLRATVKASLLLAPGIAYQGLYDYLKASGHDIRLPTVEVYTPGNSINEMGHLSVDMAD